MGILLTSDTHFGAERTRQLSYRPFDSVYAMDDCLVTNHNNIVTTNDIVYHAGDFGNYEMVKELAGRIILVFGNYEENDLIIKFNNDFQAFKDYLLDLGFYSVIRGWTYIEDIRVVHKPSMCDKNGFNCFGHIHNTQKVRRYGINVGTDCNFFRPVTWDYICKQREAIEKYYDYEVFGEEPPNGTTKFEN